MHAFIPFLQQRLDRSLPGADAQLKMAPSPLDDGPGRKLRAPSDANRSSVLILLFPNKERNLEIVLTLRSSDIDHGGQISFPGGRSEHGESVIETALREADEEIGVPGETVTILGTLSNLYVNHSNNQVTPVVGYADSLPDFQLSPLEVEEVFTIELDPLLAKKNMTIENWDLHQYSYKVPYWDVHRVPLWGATAMMLSEFLEIYREFKLQASNPK